MLETYVTNNIDPNKQDTALSDLARQIINNIVIEEDHIPLCDRAYKVIATLFSLAGSTKFEENVGDHPYTKEISECRNHALFSPAKINCKFINPKLLHIALDLSTVFRTKNHAIFCKSSYSAGDK